MENCIGILRECSSTDKILYRSYFRSSGTMISIQILLKSFIHNITNAMVSIQDTNIRNQSLENISNSLLLFRNGCQILFECCKGQYLSLVQLIKDGLVSDIIQLLGNITLGLIKNKSDINSKLEIDFKCVLLSILLLLGICRDPIENTDHNNRNTNIGNDSNKNETTQNIYCDISRNAILHNAKLWQILIYIIQYINMMNNSHVSDKVFKKEIVDVNRQINTQLLSFIFEVLQSCIKRQGKGETNALFILPENQFSHLEEGKEVQSVAEVVSTIAALLAVLLTQSTQHTVAMESALECLLLCTQIEQFRQGFAQKIRDNLPKECILDATMKLQTPIEVVVHVAKLFPPFRYISLGILMNICVSSAGDHANVISELLRCGGLQTALAAVSLDAVSRDSSDPLVLARSAGLLARLTLHEEVRKHLEHPDVYRRVCRCLALNIRSKIACDQDPHSSEESWIVEERAHLVRALASVTNLSEEIKLVALEENLICSLVSVFPMPCDDLGEITPLSVTLPPKKPATAILLGNTAKCLMPYADDARTSSLIYCDSKLKGIERIVCAMASCADMRVRKNVAILLAKGCKLNGVKARIEHLRGLQMMIELQSSLL